MGNAKLWWWPVGATAIEEIDFGGTLADLQVTPQRVAKDARAPWGRTSRYDLGGFTGVRLSKERIQNNAALIRDLASLIRHLQAGGVCSFSLDADKAWGTWTQGPVLPGTAVTVSPAGNAFTSLNASAALTSGDEITIESPAPEYLLDVNTYSSLSAATLTTGENIRTGFVMGPCFVRYRYFYPVLRLPESAMNDAGLLQHDRLLFWNLALPLEENPGDILAIRESVGALLGSAGSGTTMDQILAGALGAQSRTQTRYRTRDRG